MTKHAKLIARMNITHAMPIVLCNDCLSGGTIPSEEGDPAASPGLPIDVIDARPHELLGQQHVREKQQTQPHVMQQAVHGQQTKL